MSGTLRVLMSVYACEPGKGSESGLGWDHVEAMGREHQIWAITRTKNLPVLEAHLANAPMPNVKFAYYDLPSWLQFFQKGELEFLYYTLWQFGAYFTARRLQREVGFDVSHHITFATDWLPSLISLLPVPFLWGPVGGADTTPAVFRKDYSLRGRVLEKVRDTVQTLSLLNPFVRLTARHAAVGIASTPKAEQRIFSMGCRQTLLYPNTALAEDEVKLLGEIPEPPPGTFRVATLGRLIHWKGGALALRSFAHFSRQYPSSEHWLIGDGPEAPRLRKLAQELGIADRVKFWGQMPRSEVFTKLAQCSVLLQPSLHDSGGGVHLEAMAARRPVVCLDLGGPSLSVSAATGFKIPAESPEQCIRDLANALGQLAGDPAFCRKMGEAARQRVLDSFCWKGRAKKLTQLYRLAATNLTRPKGRTPVSAASTTREENSLEKCAAGGEAR